MSPLLLLAATLVAQPESSAQQRFGLQWAKRLQGASSSRDQRSRPAIEPKLGLVIVGTDAGELLAMDLGTGEVRWRQTLKGRVSGSPVIYGPAVVVTAGDGFLHAFQVATGQPVWAHPLGTEPMAPPVIDRGRIYLQNGLDQLVVLNLADGSERWACDRYEDGDRPSQVTIFGHSRPQPILLPPSERATAERLLLVGSSNGHLTAYNEDPVEGGCEVIWERRLGKSSEDFGDVDAGPVVLDGIVYTAAYNNGVMALRAADGRLVWKRPTLEGVHRIAADHHRVYAASRDQVLALDRRNGKTVWRYRFTPGVPTDLVVRAGRLWFGRANGPLTILRAADGEPLQVFDPGTGFSTAPVVRSTLAWAFSNGGVLYMLAKGQPDAL